MQVNGAAAPYERVDQGAHGYQKANGHAPMNAQDLVSQHQQHRQQQQQRDAGAAAGAQQSSGMSAIDRRPLGKLHVLLIVLHWAGALLRHHFHMQPGRTASERLIH